MVPVEQVSVPFLQTGDGVDDMSQAFHSLLLGDEAQFGGADDGRHRVADIGGRSLVVGFHLAVQLVVVGHQPVVLFGHQAVEEIPGVLGQLANLVGLLLGERLLVLREFLAQPEHQEGSTAPSQHTEEHGQKVDNRAGAEHEEQDDNGRSDIVEPEFIDIVAQGAFGALGRLVAGNPVQQILVREPHPVACAHCRIGVHPSLLGEQRELHQRAVQDNGEATHQCGIIVVAFAEIGQFGDLSKDEEDDGACHSH